MPRVHKITTDLASPDRLNRYLKTILDNTKNDRERALAAYQYFETLVNENSNDDTSKTCMVNCLKLMQSSQTSLAKVTESLYKMICQVDGKGVSQATVNLFDALEKERDKKPNEKRPF